MAKPKPNAFQRLGFERMTPQERAEVDRELAAFGCILASEPVPFDDDEPCIDASNAEDGVCHE